MKTVLEAVQENVKKERKSRRDAATRERSMLALIEDHFLPHMPRTLERCFELSTLIPNYGRVFSGFIVVFRPVVDTGQEAENKRAIGTITKVATGLVKGGWAITTEPHAMVREYSKEMGIELTASRVGEKGRQITLAMTFGGIKNTDNCRLVEKEVIIEASYTPERKGTRLVVECDE